MKKVLLVVLMFRSVLVFCQEPIKSNCINSASFKLKQNSILIDSLQRLLKTLEMKDDSIYNSILNGTFITQPTVIDTFNYKQTRIDYQNFKTQYKDYIKSNEFPKVLPLDSVQNKSIIGFGSKWHPIYKTKESHLGIDIPALKGTIVKSTMYGKVLSTKNSYGRDGNHIIIQNRNIKTVFSHLEKISVSEGEMVKLGQVIGTVGDSGLSVAYHLHYEILFKDIQINPIFVLFEKFKKEDLEYIFTKNCMSMD